MSKGPSEVVYQYSDPLGPDFDRWKEVAESLASEILRLPPSVSVFISEDTLLLAKLVRLFQKPGVNGTNQQSCIPG